MTGIDLVEEAITQHWGERCEEFYAGCRNCQTWSAYDDLVGNRAELTRLRAENEALREAAKPFADEAQYIRSHVEDATTYVSLEGWPAGNFRRLAALTKGDDDAGK